MADRLVDIDSLILVETAEMVHKQGEWDEWVWRPRCV